MPRKHSAFATFLFSVMPGGGHMFLGLMKRGTQLMAVFWVCFILALMFKQPLLGVPMMVTVWFYAQFEAMHIRRKLNLGTPVEDTPIFSQIGFTWKPLYTGVLILAFGGWLLIQNLSMMIASALPRFVRDLIANIGDMMPALLLVLVGLLIIANINRKRALPPPQDEQHKG